MLQLPPVKIDLDGRQYAIALPCPPIDLVRAASFHGSEGGDLKLGSLLRDNPSLLIYALIRFEQSCGVTASSFEELSGWMVSNQDHLQSIDADDEQADKIGLLPWSKLKDLACRFNQSSKPKKKAKILGRFLEAACSIDRQTAKQILKSAIPVLDSWRYSDRKGAEKTRISCESIDRKWGPLTKNPTFKEKDRHATSSSPKGLNGASNSSVLSLLEPASNGRISREVNRFAGSTKRSSENHRDLEKSEAIDESFFQKRLLEEKLASLQQLAYGASHEINNPLANIATRAQSLIVGEKDPERLHKLGVIYEQAMRAHEMISDLMLFANPPTLKFETIQLREFLRKLNHQVTESLFQYLPGIFAENGQSSSEKKIKFAIRIAPNLTTLRADSTQMMVALQALIRNSMEACRTGREFIELRVSATEKEYCFSVSDDGIGIATEIRRHMFDPFYSGREAGRGLGFGLCKAWRIARLHSGDLSFVEDHSPGARFDLKIPNSNA